MCQYFPSIQLREDVSIHRIELRYFGKSHKIRFHSYFNICSPICPNNRGAAFLWKYILVFKKWLFSFDRSKMQIFTVIITRVVRPRETNIPTSSISVNVTLFYHLNLIPFHYWSWQRNISFWWILLSNILFLCRKVASKQRQF